MLKPLYRRITDIFVIPYKCTEISLRLGWVHAPLDAVMMNPDTSTEEKSPNSARSIKNSKYMQSKNIDEVLKGNVTTVTQNIKNNDSMVMMKMVVTGPPKEPKLKKSTILSPTLLQSITELTRSQQHQTVTEEGKTEFVSAEKISRSINKCVAKRSTTCACTSKEFSTCIGTHQPQKHAICSTQYTRAEDSTSKQTKTTIAQSLEMDDSAILKISDTLESKSGLNIHVTDNSVVASFLNRIRGATFDHSEEVIICTCSKTTELGSQGPDVVNKSDSTRTTVHQTAEVGSSVGVCEMTSNISSNITPETVVNMLTTVTASKPVCETDPHEQENNSHLIGDQVIEGVSLGAVTQEYLGTEGEICGEPSTSLHEEDPFGHMDVENITESVEEGDIKPKVDHVYDVSPLFTGELEKWRRRELKKDLKRGNQKWTKDRKKNKSHTVSENRDSSEDGNIRGRAKPKEERKPIPNYFVAIQITNPKIHAALKKVQDDVVSSDGIMASAVNKLPTLHLTMFVLHLTTDDEMRRAKLAMNECCKRLQPTYTDNPLYLDIAGLGNFRNAVVFAEVKPKEEVEQLQSIADTIEDSFLDQELVSSDKGGFKPHITVMKLSRARDLRKKGIRKIKEELYRHHIEEDFGQQSVNTLQLCAMLKRKDTYGYYQVEHQVQFGPDIEETTKRTRDITDGAAIRHDVELVLNNIVNKVVEDTVTYTGFDELGKVITNEDIAEIDRLISNTDIDKNISEVRENKVEIMDDDTSLMECSDSNLTEIIARDVADSVDTNVANRLDNTDIGVVEASEDTETVATIHIAIEDTIR